MPIPFKFFAKSSLAGGMILSLAGCSYVYDTYDFNRDGALYFGLVPGQDLPKSGALANCIKHITVEVADVKPVEQKAKDGTVTKTYPRVIMWELSGPQSKCLLKFPFKYGQQPISGITKISAKQLQVGVKYRLTVTSRDSGHGGHTFTFK